MWADLAHIAPELVTIDLVLAEMLAAADDAHHLKEKS